MICAFDVRDKEPKLRKDGKDLISTPLSEEVLISKGESDKFKETVQQIRDTINSQREARAAKKKFELEQTQNEIDRICNQIVENQNTYNQRLLALETAKQEMEHMYEMKLIHLAQAHQLEVERRTQDYSAKMDADAERYKELYN